jgi:hypothetical protein
MAKENPAYIASIIINSIKMNPECSFKIYRYVNSITAFEGSGGVLFPIYAFDIWIVDI